MKTKGDESTGFQADQSAKDILLIRTRLLDTPTVPEIDDKGEDLMDNEYLWNWSRPQGRGSGAEDVLLSECILYISNNKLEWNRVYCTMC